VLQKGQRDRSSDSRARAGDQRNLSLPVHVSSSAFEPAILAA
jgi:hypothetical protein